MDKTTEDEVVFEAARDIFQNDVHIGSYVMYPGRGYPPHHPLMTGVVSVLYHVPEGDLYMSLYKIGIAYLEEFPHQGTSIYYLDYPEADFIVMAEGVISKLLSGQAINTHLFTSRMWELRQEIINDAS